MRGGNQALVGAVAANFGTTLSQPRPSVEWAEARKQAEANWPAGLPAASSQPLRWLNINVYIHDSRCSAFLAQPALQWRLFCYLPDSSRADGKWGPAKQTDEPSTERRPSERALEGVGLP